MKNGDCSIPKGDNENESDEPSDNELDEPSFVFFGLDFQGLSLGAAFFKSIWPRDALTWAGSPF